MGILEDKLKLLPTNPGVYVMLDGDKQIIYVGKAKNLKNRVRQYFFDNEKPEKVKAMVKNIADFYYYIAPSEIDALSLENNLIKKYKPRYNILLKDDKTYPYIKINLKENFPTFKVTRRIYKDGAKYFGPYMGGVNVNGVMDILSFAFNVRLCDKKLSKEKFIKPCLNYHIKKCLAPCAGFIGEKEYNKKISLALDFLNGDTEETEKALKEKMLSASEKEDFELALKYKENLLSLEKIKQKRVTALNRFINADIIAYRTNGVYSAISVLFVRKGIMLGGKNFSSENLSDGGDALREFVLRYYNESSDIPDEIITEIDVAEADILEEYFKAKLNKTVNLTCAKKGDKRQLVNMAVANAEEHLNTAINRIKHKDDMTIVACKRLQEILNLSRYPKRMECYDISHISGTDRVGSMVVFIDGEKDGDSYRRFKIKTFEGNDDFKSLQEVLKRRIERLSSDPEKFPKPDLIIIDGGKGQLSSVKEIFDEYGITDIDLISLAKKEEEIFTPNKSEPVVLPKSDYCLKMLQRIRDEAHRFAITFHRELRGKRALSSVLDGIKGLGKKRVTALIERFKDIGGIISATKEELEQVEGIGEKQAQAIIDALTKEGLK